MINPLIQNSPLMQKAIIFIFSLVFCEFIFAQDFWMELHTPDSVIIYKTEISPEGNILLCTSKGPYYSLDDGISWQKMGDLTYGVTNIEYFSDGEIVAGGGMLFNSVDQGQTWNLINSYLMMKTLFRTSNNSLLLGDWGGIYKSVDRGYTWDSVHPTGTASVFPSFIEKEGVCFSGCSDYIGENSGLYRSDDYGDTWNLFSLQEHGITKMILDNEQNILAGVCISPSGLYNGLYKSTDDGLSWSYLFTQQQVVQVAADSMGGIYIGLESGGPFWGVYYSSDSGFTWQELNSGLIHANSVYDLDVSSNYIYVILLNYKSQRILYRSINPIVAIHENDITNIPAIEVFPNPVGPASQINIKNRGQLEYNLDVFNELGIRIISNIKIANNHIDLINLNISNWDPGLYIFRFYNDSSVITKAIIKTQ